MSQQTLKQSGLDFEGITPLCSVLSNICDAHRRTVAEQSLEDGVPMAYFSANRMYAEKNSTRRDNISVTCIMKLLRTRVGIWKADGKIKRCGFTRVTATARGTRISSLRAFPSSSELLALSNDRQDHSSKRVQAWCRAVKGGDKRAD